MSKFNFPNNYIQTISKEKVLLYKSLLEDLVVETFKKDCKTINIAAPIFVNYSASTINEENRVINFDNKNTNEIYSLNPHNGYYLSYSLLKLSDEVNFQLFLKSYEIKRDALCNHYDSVVNDVIYFERNVLLSDQSSDHFSKLLFDYFNHIVTEVRKQKFKNIFSSKYFDYTKKPIIIDSQEIKKNHPFVKSLDALKVVSAKEKTLIIKNPSKPLKSKAVILKRGSLIDDDEKTAVLIAYSKTLSQPIEIMKMSARYFAKEQTTCLININNLHGEEEKVKELMRKKNPTVGIKINITNLLALFLDKYHVAEVVESVWSSEFTFFCQKNKIRI